MVGHPGRVTSNRDNKQERIKVGEKLDVQWIDLDDVESPKDDLRQRGFKAGAASFARGEGMWASTDAIYFACTSGGRAELGQVWRYTPSASEGEEDERKQPGKLQLFIEPNDITLLCNADNLTVAPWGEVIICENRKRGTPHRLVCATPAGEILSLGHPSVGGQRAGRREFLTRRFNTVHQHPGPRPDTGRNGTVAGLDKLGKRTLPGCGHPEDGRGVSRANQTRQEDRSWSARREAWSGGSV